MPYHLIPEIGEFGLIGKIAKLAAPTLEAVPELIEGIGDDCAVYRLSENLLQVSTTDILVDQVHFDLLTTPLKHLGSKAISVNVSDVCAMNAIPRCALVSLAIPPSFPVEMIEELYRGMAQASLEYGVAIAGGDTSSSRSGLVISVSVTGEVAPDRIALRKGASAGELLCVTGTLGGAAAGLRLLIREKGIMLEHLENSESFNRNLMADLEEYRNAIRSQLIPMARLDIVKYFHSSGLRPTSMIDISDGLSSELQHICRSSQCGAIIYENRIPIGPETRLIADELQDDALTWALTGGEDYELLFTLPKESLQEVSAHRNISVIGEITPADQGIAIRDIYGMNIDLGNMKGFDHFHS
ncbi:MAG: thiamine-phosphate kinase [Chlorobiaceae bacterium]|nr:thiamine-phosphate kinase [Chlorobiaceae bacterium]